MIRDLILLSVFTTFMSCSAQENKVKMERDSLSSVVRFFENKEMIFTKTFIDSLENGLSVRIDPESKKVKYIYDSYNKEPRGLLMNFYSDGSIKSIREADIYGEGQYIEFHYNGTLKELSYRVKGRTTGWVYRYDENGKILSKKYYVNGEVSSPRSSVTL